MSKVESEEEKRRARLDARNARAREKRAQTPGSGIRCLGSMKDAKKYLSEQAKSSEAEKDGLKKPPTKRTGSSGTSRVKRIKSNKIPPGRLLSILFTT